MPFGFLAGAARLAGGAAKALAKKGVIRGSAGRILRGRGARTAAVAVPTAVAIQRGRPRPQMPAGVPRLPQGGARGVARRIAPGGRSGYTYDPYDLDTPSDKLGRPVAVQPEMAERIKCPPGYVAVDLDGDGIKDACVLKGMARGLGLWKSRPKPPISGYDARAIKRAERAKKRVKKLAGGVGFTCAPKGSRRKK